MKARNTKRVMIKDGKPVTPMGRIANSVCGVVVTPADEAVILKAIRDGDKD